MFKLSYLMKPPARLQLAFFGGGIGGMIAGGIAAYLYEAIGWGSPSPQLIFIPWMVAGMLLIPAAYKSGRNSNAAEQGPAANP